MYFNLTYNVENLNTTTILQKRHLKKCIILINVYRQVLWILQNPPHRQARVHL